MQSQKQTAFDGSQIFKLVENKEAFSSFVDGKFAALDVSPRDGALSRKELQPAVTELGVALGLPPRGLSPDSDHIYDELLTEFFHGKKNEKTISKNDFAVTLRDLLLGIADGLQRNPISVLQVNGSELRKYVDGAEFEVDAVGVFSEVDSNSEGAIQGSQMQQLLQSRTFLQRLPAGYDEATKYLLEKAMSNAGVDAAGTMDQATFISTLKKILLSTSSMLEEKPLNVAYTESTYDGSSIQTFLRDKEATSKVLREIWRSIPKGHKGKTSTDVLALGLDNVAPYVGLPPMGAVDEMDHVYEVVLKAERESQPEVNEEGFQKDLLEIIASIMLQLQGKSISVKSSSVVNETGNFDVLSI